MQYIYGTENIKLTKKSIVVLGNFDGVHIGHLELFKKAQEIGKKKNLQTVVFSFYPHPTWLLGNHPKPLLMCREEKKNKVSQLGIDVYVEYPFTLQVAHISAVDFITEIFLKKLNGQAVVIGNNYFFGKNKEGNASYMKELGRKYGFDVFVLPEVTQGSITVSSTLIRELIMQGKTHEVIHLLGHPYTVQGKIIKGKQLGRTLGFPTINVIPDAMKVLPPNGVYITTVTLLDKQYNGLTNIGYNPTVNGKTKTIETYIFNFSQIVYGEKVEIAFIQYLRSEMKFDSITQLVAQINKDKAYTEQFFEQYKE